MAVGLLSENTLFIHLYFFKSYYRFTVAVSCDQTVLLLLRCLS